MELKTERAISSLMNLQGRVALITGGAGNIGLAIANALAELGASICLLDRDPDMLNRAAVSLNEHWHVDVETFVIDLEDETQRKLAIDLIKKSFGRLDILVNNAGFVGDSDLQGWVVPFYEQSIETWRRVMEVNLTAAFHLSQLLSPMLKKNRKGSIINVGSIYGVVGPDLRLYDETGMGNPAAYSISKGGLIQCTRWLSTVLAPDIRVNSISPGGVARGQPSVFVERYVARTPLGRMGKEEDFKGAIAFFASDLSSWVTGENLMIDGGWTIW